MVAGVSASMLYKISRPKMWIASVITYLFAFPCAPPVAEPLFWMGLIYATFPFNLFIMGWNDIQDYDIDVKNPRKVCLRKIYFAGWLWVTSTLELRNFVQGGSSLYGALATIIELTALPLPIILFNFPFVIYFFLTITCGGTLLW